jgi:hypothetical protein
MTNINEPKNKIKTIIKSEITILISKISEDFIDNYKRKIHNWTLAKFDKTLVAHMVFVSSFESKSGNMFQSIAKQIAKLRYGAENVPSVFKGVGVTDDDINQFKKSFNGTEQIILTKINQSACQEFIALFKENHKAKGRGTDRIPPSINQETIKEINNQKLSRTDFLTFKPIDLGIYDSENDLFYIIEIKAGGDLDSSNAPGNVIKMLTEYAALGKTNSHLYFTTLYNKNGEGNTWTGIIKQYLSNEMILIGKDFWELILPKEITFDELKCIYNEANKELNINSKIADLISSVHIDE